jgi:two-component system, NarL family, invasion response regulator UvrY
VLCKMAAGIPPITIAEQLNVSPKTVHSYRARLLQKLGLHSNAELIRYAIEHGHSEG